MLESGENAQDQLIIYTPLHDYEVFGGPRLGLFSAAPRKMPTIKIQPGPEETQRIARFLIASIYFLVTPSNR